MKKECTGKPIRVLLVDDEEDLVVFLAQRLEKRSCTVQTATSGEDAVAVAKTTTFDVAIVDLQMPHMDGIAVMTKLHGLQPFLQLVMLTGHGSHESAWEAGKVQAFRYLIKPYDFDKLVELIQEACATRRQGMSDEYRRKYDELLAGNPSPRDIVAKGDKLRRQYEQD